MIYIFYIVAGLLSGAMSGVATVIIDDIGGIFSSTMPGVIFGLVFAVLFLIFLKTRLDYTLYFIAISILACFLAVQTAIYVTLGTDVVDIGIFAGGGLGAIVLGSGISLFIFKLNSNQIFFLAISGALLGLLGWSPAYYLLAESSGSMNNFSPNILYSLYIIWQTGIAIIIGVYHKKYIQSDPNILSPQENPAP